jgi:hypothetical protein
MKVQTPKGRVIEVTQEKCGQQLVRWYSYHGIRIMSAWDTDDWQTSLQKLDELLNSIIAD